MRASSLRNINVSETVYGGADEDGELFSKPNINEEFVDMLTCNSKCDDECFETFKIVSFISWISVISFNIAYSLSAVYNESNSDIQKLCPENYVWYYMLSNITLLNYIYYTCVKIYNNMEKKPAKKIVSGILFITNALSSGVGYHYLYNNNCIENNFKDKQIYKIAVYNVWGQAIFSCGSLIYFCNHYRTIHLEKSEKKSNVNKSNESNESNESEKENQSSNNIIIEVIEKQNQETQENQIINHG